MTIGAEHSSKTYDAQIRRLRERLLVMGATVEDMLSKTEAALQGRDVTLAEAVKRLGQRVDKLECEVDELAMRLVATRQPVASDLRLITAAFKMVTDIERMGKSCANICDRVIELCAAPPLDVGNRLDLLCRDVVEIVHDCLSILASPDEAKAYALLERDAAIDEQYHRIFQELVALMADQPDSVYRATRTQVIAKYLERIADHAVNIAKNVIFVLSGDDVRHHD
jgi:phosphate transport system protein